MQGGGGYGYGGGMGNGNMNGNMNGNGPQRPWSRASSYVGQGEESNDQMVMSPQTSYIQDQQRAASPLPNVSSGYAPRTSANASPIAFSPSMSQNNMVQQSRIPPLSLNPQYSNSRNTTLAASPMSEVYNPSQYYSNQQPMQYSPYQNYQAPQYETQTQAASTSVYGATGDLKHRIPTQNNEWSSDGHGAPYSPSRKTYSPNGAGGKYPLSYDNGAGEYGYNTFGGPTKKNRVHNFLMTGHLRFLVVLLIPSLYLLFSAVKTGGSSIRMYPSSGNFDVKIGEKDLDKLGDGISIVGACMNRQERLEKVLDNWLSMKDAKEVILVDWSSEPPLKSIVNKFKDKRLKLVRVDDEPNWVLSRAFNIGMQFASYDRVIRLDCDYAISENFTESHPIEQGKNFYSGDYKNAKVENEVHLNGAMHVHQKDFWKVMGYDERIQTYGWDDEDMYGRLSNNAKLNRDPVNYKHIVHFPHDDSQRAQSGIEFVEVQTDYNRIMLEKLPVWGPEIKEKSAYNVVADGNFYELKAIERPRSVADLTPEPERVDAFTLALGRRLHDTYGVPWDVLQDISIENKELLLRRLMAKTVKDEEPPKILFGHAMHGLGNRLRALGSMLAYARKYNKELVLIWENDEHCGADFNDLFSDEIVLMKKFHPKYPFTDNAKYDDKWNLFNAYNYMEMEEGANKGQPIEDDPLKHTYYKGAYVMEPSDWNEENESLRTLTPHPEVQKIIDEHKNADFTNYVGVHIRNRGLDQDIKNVDFSKEYTESASATMDYWRSKSHYSNFIDRMRSLLMEDPKLEFYVASDTFTVQSEMEKQFPGKIHTTDRACDDRDASCVRYALADLYNLGKTKKMLGSNWSSFTEAAQRFGGIQAELAGQDFAADENRPQS
mmetsp:Transcript_12253/g.37372  ORF Transcript_12253/g.37372 Transcript_12253/m.37372 type:complete len:884 (+) Transcript_12253:122-2773(+)